MRHLMWLLLLPLALAQAAEVPDTAFSEHAVTLERPGGTLYGTELVPEVDGKVPVVLLHPGSGPTDRDGNSTQLPGHNNSLRMVAEALARRGIASVRYDKRMIGASVSPAWKEADIRFDDFVGDLLAWVPQLRADPRFARLVLVGHSEGALIVTAACTRSGADGCVSIAGIARPFADVLTEQVAPRLTPELLAQNQRILALLKQGKAAPDVPPELAPLYRPSVQPYLISLMRYDPAALTAALTTPLLILQGTSDIQVPVREAQALAAADARARLVIVDGMNHVMKLVGTDPALQQRSYSSPDLPVAPQLMDALADFVAGLR